MKYNWKPITVEIVYDFWTFFLVFGLKKTFYCNSETGTLFHFTDERLTSEVRASIKIL